MSDITVHGVRNVQLVTEHNPMPRGATLDGKGFVCPPYSIMKMFVEARDGQVLTLNLFLDDRATSAISSLQAVSCPESEEELRLGPVDIRAVFDRGHA
jgi:hypothetical protein